jgi:protein-tyrosine-phosphatase
LIREQAFPKGIKHILIICKGNICRSPLAEAYLKHVLAMQMQRITVDSAGLETSVGRPAHNFAKAVGQVEGLKLDSHETRPLLKDHIEKADLIVVMEYAHHYRLLKLFPHARDKVFLLRQFIHSQEVEIADPYSGTLSDFQECFDIIRQSCDSLIKEIGSVNVDK